jgi:beta-glucanase (GH16 family)
MRLLILCLILCGITHLLPAQLPPEDKNWHLVFDDQFDSLNHQVWKVADNFDHYGEPQVYTKRPENVFVHEGELILQVLEEKYRCSDRRGAACNKAHYDFTSGWVETGLWSNIQYGYLEARIKLPHGPGFWPAFWTFGLGGEKDRSNVAEIDIFEMLGSHPSTQMGTNLHLDYCKCPDNSCPCEYLGQVRCPDDNSEILCHGLDVEIPDYSDNYLTYGLEWTPNKIIWYINGQMVRNSGNPGIVDPVRIIFNLAITPWKLPTRDTPFPSTMHIDYFKFYQLNREAHIQDTLRLGGEGNGPEILPFDNITFRAKKEIGIEGEFYVPLGATVYMDVNRSK